jgi:hypothetical protein
MTATRTTETLITPPPARPPWGVLTAAGLTVIAALALTPWLTPSSQIEPSLITSNWAAATPSQPTSAVRQASAPSYAPNIDSWAPYALSCQKSPVMCASSAPTPPDTGYVLFCRNSPVLCASSAPRPPDTGTSYSAGTARPYAQWRNQITGFAARVRSRVG